VLEYAIRADISESGPPLLLSYQISLIPKFPALKSIINQSRRIGDYTSYFCRIFIERSMKNE